MKKIVFFQGAFDIINYGHIKAIQRAASCGNYLIIGLNTDRLYRKYKKRNPVLPYWQRKVILQAIRGVSKVIPARSFSPLNILKRYDIDVYVIAKEWKETKDKEIAYIKSKGKKIVWVKRYSKVLSSTDIKDKMKLFLDQGIDF